MSAWDDARRKIRRANEHIRDIETRIAALHKTDASRVEMHPQFGTEILIHEFADPEAFDDLAVMIGDALHNLKCALDYAWWETTTRFIPAFVGGRTKLPVREKREELEGWLRNPGKNKSGIDSLCPQLSRFLLDGIRPYRGGNHAIWPIHVLDGIDKHRLLIPVLTAVYIEGMSVIDEHGEPWIVNGSTRSFQRPPYHIQLSPGLHFKEHGELTATVIIKDRHLEYGLRVPVSLSHYSDLIVQVIESFEGFFES